MTTTPTLTTLEAAHAAAWAAYRDATTARNAAWKAACAAERAWAADDACVAALEQEQTQ